MLPEVDETCSVCGQITHKANETLAKTKDCTESHMLRMCGGETFAAPLHQVSILFHQLYMC